MDQRRWDDWEALFAEDATIHVFMSDKEFCFWKGRNEIMSGNIKLNTGNKAIHQSHMPDIDLTSDTSARASWILEDTYLTQKGKIEQFGYYEDEYVKITGEWKIKAVVCRLYSK